MTVAQFHHSRMAALKNGFECRPFTRVAQHAAAGNARRANSDSAKAPRGLRDLRDRSRLRGTAARWRRRDLGQPRNLAYLFSQIKQFCMSREALQP